MFSLYDTMSSSEVALPSVDEKKTIGMYVCGPTVYQRAHIGNARPYIVFAWMKNWLISQGYDVNFVHNITDINDKIYEHTPEGVLSTQHAIDMAKFYNADIASLGLPMPDAMPTVTDTMSQIITFIEQIIAAGHGYVAGEDVYFDVASSADYGKLSGTVDHETLGDGDAAHKKDPRDFALWKSAKPGEDTHWDSPWGKGRPGWHIECSAMAHSELGEAFEIHGGGNDLTFPHHENEVAQSTSVGYAFAKIWAHSGMLTLGGEKMSKSLGNIDPIHAAVERWGAETLLLMFLNSHWHSPVEYSQKTLQAAESRLNTLLEANATVKETEPPADEWAALETVLNKNFNTAEALALLHEWVNKGYKELAAKLLAMFGLGRVASPPQPPADVAAVAQQRLQAKADKDYEQADALRAQVEAAGWLLRDEVDGQVIIPTVQALR